MDDFGDFGPNVYESLPEDPEQAFLLLERKYRSECETRIANAYEGENTRVFYVEYIAQVLAAIEALELEYEFDSRVPNIEDVTYETYLNFSKDVKHYRTKLDIRHGRRVQGYSVQFDAATKVKVKHHIDQLRGVFERLEVEHDKREALFDRLNELQKEVDRDRTRFDAFAAMVIESAGVVGDAVDRSKVLDILNAIGRVIWGTKKEQETKRLPPPKPPKRLEPPQAKAARPPRVAKARALDDDIPF